MWLTGGRVGLPEVRREVNLCLNWTDIIARGKLGVGISEQEAMAIAELTETSDDLQALIRRVGGGSSTSQGGLRQYVWDYEREIGTLPREMQLLLTIRVLQNRCAQVHDQGSRCDRGRRGSGIRGWGR